MLSRLPGLLINWLAIWGLAGSAFWFVAEFLRHKIVGNKLLDDSGWTIMRAGLFFGAIAFIAVIPMFGIDMAQHANFEYAPDQLSWFDWTVPALLPSMIIAPFAALAGLVWGTVFWLRQPENNQTMEVAA